MGYKSPKDGQLLNVCPAVVLVKKVWISFCIAWMWRVSLVRTSVFEPKKGQNVYSQVEYVLVFKSDDYHPINQLRI